MIQSNELRIGNLLQCADSDNYFEVTAEDLQIIDSGSSKAKPIPLTKEWLLKAGFYENRNHNPSWQLDVKLGFSIWGRIGKGFNVFVDSDEIGNSIQYVHQLQNLYFALTQKELEL